MNSFSQLSKGFAAMFDLNATTHSWLEYAILGAAVLLVTGAVVFWAAVIRKPKKERRYKHSHRPPQRQQSTDHNLDTAEASPKSERRRRSFNRRNPTLAEVRRSQSASKGETTATEVYHR